MATINNSINSLLTGYQNNGSNGINLGDYASIKNGSYKKLLKSYYAQENVKTNNTGETKADNKEAKKKLTMMQESASKLEGSARELMDSSLFEKVTDNEGKSDFPWDSIVKAVKNFMESYNDTIDEAAESDDKSVLRNAVWLTNSMNTNKALFNDLGLKLGTDNKLTLDEDKLKKADISTMKSMFTGTTSIMGRIRQRAVNISNAAKNAGGTYNKSGKYSPAVNKIVSSKIDTEV